MQNPIYKPKGAAGEYAPYALNIYTECDNGCWYCYARQMAKRFGKEWTGNVKAREGIVEAVKKQLKQEKMEDKTIFLCFTCDPYPKYCDTTATTKIIKLIKQSGANVKILTKNPTYAASDIELLDGFDWFGVTLTGAENYKEIYKALSFLEWTKKQRVNTWISFEPILQPKQVEYLIFEAFQIGVDLVAIGKLNHFKSDTNWAKAGRELEEFCQALDINYAIKESLQKEMDK